MCDACRDVGWAERIIETIITSIKYMMARGGMLDI
jgi:hypothetical protein